MLNQFWCHNELSLAANLYFDRFYRTNLITDELDERLGRAVDHGVGHHSGLPERRPQGQPGEDVPEVRKIQFQSSKVNTCTYKNNPNFETTCNHVRA